MSEALPPVVMDLGDFYPEVTHFRFKIGEREYAGHYQEATVDEVFRMLARGAEPTPETLPEVRRRMVAEFYGKHLTKGDAESLAADLELVPYQRLGAPFDIDRLYAPMLMRVKKNESGANPERP